MFFVPCLIGGLISVIVGLIKSKDPFKAKKMFFIGGVSFIAPVVIAVIFTTIERINSEPGCDYTPYTLVSETSIDEVTYCGKATQGA
jgi:hypothetical protein